MINGGYVSSVKPVPRYHWGELICYLSFVIRHLSFLSTTRNCPTDDSTQFPLTIFPARRTVPSDQAQFETIRTQTLSQLASLRANPKPSYTVDGQSVSWESYVESLQRTVDWCDEKLAGREPFEEHTQART